MHDDKIISIIIADDHNIVRYGLKQSLSQEKDMQVIAEADTGRKVIELMASVTPDVILMDISMPDLNGIDATRQILKSYPKTSIIALSMYADKQYVLSMLRSGARGYLLKSNLFKELLVAVRTVFEGDIFLSAKITKYIVESAIHSNSDERTSLLFKLTLREREILQLITEGKSSEDIGNILFISKKTVDSHRHHIMEKLELYNTPALTKFAIKHGISSLEF